MRDNDREPSGLGALDAFLAAGVYDLGQPFDRGMTTRPMHVPFRMGSILRHGDVVGPDGHSTTLELIAMSTHTGTHVDALAHVAHEGTLFGGVGVDDVSRGGVFTSLGVETISPLVYRGVLLDVAGSLGVEAVEASHRVSADNLERACRWRGVEVSEGDAVLIRLGWGAPERYASPEYLGIANPLPGVDVSGASWLIERRAALTGTDTTAYECLEPGEGARPVHRMLLREAGIYIVENLALDELARSGAGTFALVVAPLTLVGATGGPVRPVALVFG